MRACRQREASRLKVGLLRPQLGDTLKRCVRCLASPCLEASHTYTWGSTPRGCQVGVLRLSLPPFPAEQRERTRKGA